MTCAEFHRAECRVRARRARSARPRARRRAPRALRRMPGRNERTRRRRGPTRCACTARRTAERIRVPRPRTSADDPARAGEESLASASNVHRDRRRGPSSGRVRRVDVAGRRQRRSTGRSRTAHCSRTGGLASGGGRGRDQSRRFVGLDGCRSKSEERVGDVRSHHQGGPGGRRRLVPHRPRLRLLGGASSWGDDHRWRSSRRLQREHARFLDVYLGARPAGPTSRGKRARGPNDERGGRAGRAPAARVKTRAAGNLSRFLRSRRARRRARPRSSRQG